MNRYNWLTCAILLSVLAAAQTASAVTITWTGGAATNSWHTAGNWDLNRVPGTGDDVVIPDMTPNVNVTFSTGSTTINSLNSVEAFTLSGGALTIDAASSLNGSFTFANSATLTGSGDVTVNGLLDWTGTATMSGTGKTIIAPSGTLAISGGNFKTLSRRLENHSPNATWTGGQFNFNNGTFSNESDGTITVNLTAGISFSGAATSSFTNAGIVNKTGVGGWFFSGMPFNNSGTVNVDSGGLDLQNSSGGTNTGTIDVDAGTTVSFSASYTHAPSSSLIGQGTLTFNGGTHTFTGTLSTDRIININGTSVNFDAPYTFTGTVNFAGGTLGGSGDATITGTLNWTGGGTISGTGKTIIAPSGTLAILGPTNFKTLSRRLENHSPNASWTGGQFNFNNGIFSNESDGTFTVNLTAGHFFSGAGTSSFTNAGIVNKVGAGGWFFGGMPFNNFGTVNVDAGGLDLQSSSGGTNTGTIDTDAGTTLSFSVSYTHDPASSLIGQGMLTFNSGTHTFTGTLSTNRIININGTSVNFDVPYTFTGTVNLAGGTLGGSGDATIAGTLNWTGSAGMAGSGKTIIASSGTLAIVGPANFKTLSRRLENHSPNASWTGGQFNFNNGILSNESDGTFTVNLTASNFFSGAGTSSFTNAGIVNKIGVGGWFFGGMPFNNSGTVNVDVGGLDLQSSSGGTNTGTIDADAGTTISFSASYTHDPASSLIGQGTLTFNGGTHTFTGTLSTNRTININGLTVNFDVPYTFTGTVNFAGGTLGGSGDATIAGVMNWTGGGTMSGAGKTIIAPSGTLSIIGPTNFKTLSRRLENHSPNASWTGGGQVNFNNGIFSNESDGTFTANQTGGFFFSGTGASSFTNAGTVNKTGPNAWFIGGMPFTNSGTVNVQTGSIDLIGGLTNFSGTTLTGGTYNVTGTLRFANANIVTNAANIILDGPTSAIQNTSNANALANFATNSASGTFQIKNGRNFSRSGSFANAGQLLIGPGDNTLSIDTVTNTGTLTKPDTGSGNVTSSVSFINNGIIDLPSGMLILTPLSNQSGSTLTAGTYNVAGTLRYSNANIGTNAANIILDGPASAIQDLAGTNALGNIIANAATGSIQIKNGRNLALPGTFTNLGQVRIGPGDCTLSDTGNYLQSAGATTLEGGTLDPTDMADISGGELKGNGVINGHLRNGGACKPGLSPGILTINGDYEQTVSGALEVELGGTTAGTDHDRLAVSGTALLAGALRVLLINGFVPTVNDTFDVLTAAQAEVKFATIQLPILPNLHGMQFVDLPDGLRLKVIDCGPGDADGDGVGDACDTPPDLSWNTIDGGGGVSSGGIFKLSATIGQPDACSPTAPMTGGIFTLVGGFWPGVESVEEPACSLPGDMNLDGLRNGKDISTFAACVIGGTPPGCACADVNVSGAADAADISPFVQLLINQ